MEDWEQKLSKIDYLATIWKSWGVGYSKKYDRSRTGSYYDEGFTSLDLWKKLGYKVSRSACIKMLRKLREGGFLVRSRDRIFYVSYARRSYHMVFSSYHYWLVQRAEDYLKIKGVVYVGENGYLQCNR